MAELKCSQQIKEIILGCTEEKQFNRYDVKKLVYKIEKFYQEEFEEKKKIQMKKNNEFKY